jgi:Prophage tail length tape measure protein
MSNAVIGALRVVLGMDSAAFNDGVGAAQKRVAAFRKSMERAGQRLTRAGNRMSVGLTAPLVGLAYKSVAAQREQERAIASVSAALESMGDGAGYTLSQLEAMASKLQDKSLYGDEEILSKVTANLLTFGNVQGDVFARAQQLAVDLSARLGQDLQSSAIMLGKALNDPVKGLTALTRVGISFTEQQKAQIKAMAEAGDVAGAQALMLAELERQYAGQAEALANTDSGKITQAMNAIGDATEKVGAIILPIMADIAGYVKGMAERFQALSPEAQKFIVIGGSLAAAIGPIVTALGLMLTALAPMAGAILAIVSPLGLLAAGIAAAGVAIYQNWGSLKADFPAITGVIEAALDGLRSAFDRILEVGRIVFEGIMEHVRLLATGVEALLSGDFKGALDAGVAIVQSFGSTVGAVFQALFGDLVARALDMGRGIVANIQAGLEQNWQSVTSFLSKSGEGIGRAFASALGEVSKSVEGVTTQIVSGFQSLVAGLRALLSGDFAAVWQMGVDAVRQFGADLLAALAQLLADVVQAAVNIGYEIVAGIKRGLQEKWQELKDYVAGIGTGLAQGFKDVLGIRSPSRVFKSFGGYIVDGLVLGIQGGIGAIQGAVGQMAGALQMDGLNGEAQATENTFRKIGDTAGSVFGKIGQLIGEGIRGAKSYKQVLGGVLQTLGNVLLKQAEASLTGLFGGSGSIGGSLIGGLFGGLPGFANGGSFDVGGAGGIDSQVVAFRASPNETVHITKPGQGLSAAPAINFAPVIDARGADAGAVSRLEAAMQRAQAEFAPRVIQTVRSAQKKRHL